MDNQEKLYLLLSNVLQLELEEINEDTSPENTESWDSFNALVMVTELEDTFNVSFTMDEVQSVRNVKDIKYALIDHSIVFN